MAYNDEDFTRTIQTVKKTDVPNEKYKWWRDKKMVATIVIIVLISFQIFAFLKVPFFTSIHGYTIGMLMGYYNPFFYAYFVYASLNVIFEGNVRLPKWVKVTKNSYWFLVVSIIFLAVSYEYTKKDVSVTAVGKEPWKSFEIWFRNFTKEHNAWLPNNTNGGIIGAFMFSIFASVFSGVGAWIFSIILLISSFSLLLTGSLFGAYGWLSDYLKKSKTKNIIDDDDNLLESMTSRTRIKNSSKRNLETIDGEHLNKINENELDIHIQSTRVVDLDDVFEEDDKNTDEGINVFDDPFDDPFN